MFKILTNTLLCGTLLATSSCILNAMENNNPTAQQTQQIDKAMFNSSLFYIIGPLKSRGFRAEVTTVKAHITDEKDNYIIKNNNLKTKDKDAVTFYKNINNKKVELATFTFDGRPPSDRDLWIWSGCENYKRFTNNKFENKVQKILKEDQLPLDEKTALENRNLLGDEEAERIKFFITLCGLYNDDKLHPPVKISEERPLFSTPDADLPFIRSELMKLLRYPEGKMLIYSIFLNDCFRDDVLPTTSTSEADLNDIRAMYKSLGEDLCVNTYTEKEISNKVRKIYTDKVKWKLLGTQDTITFKLINSGSCHYSPDLRSVNLNVNSSVNNNHYILDDTELIAEISDIKNTTIALFHELLHCLQNSGLNSRQYASDFNNIKVNKNTDLIVRYWQQMYNIGDDHVYTKNEIHLLLNDFAKYSEPNNFAMGSLVELLAINWNNIEKKYYGNRLSESLLYYRIFNRIRDNHIELYNRKSLSKLRFIPQDFSTSYQELLKTHVVNQQYRFNGKIAKIKNISFNFNDRVIPFEIKKKDSLIFNSTGHSFEIFFKNRSVDDFSYVNKNKVCDKYKYFKTLHNIFFVHNIIDKDKKCENLNNTKITQREISYTKQELSTLLSKAFSKCIENELKREKLFESYKRLDADLDKPENRTKEGGYVKNAYDKFTQALDDYNTHIDSQHNFVKNYIRKIINRQLEY